MSSEISVSDDVKELISDIILKNNWEPVTNVVYYPGAEAGEGYACKHVVVEIFTKVKIFRLFVKYALNMPNTIDDLVEKFYTNETYFYDAVYPAYSTFLEERSVEKFKNVPRCYGTSVKNVIVLENLKDKGFVLCDRSQTMDDKHISLVLKTFAKFHAISYSFKDQEEEPYRRLSANVNKDFMGAHSQGSDSPMIRMILDMIREGLSKLDPVVDKHILDKCKSSDLFDVVTDIDGYLNEYSILTQGDCWCNNMMFLYEEESKENPVDVMLIDWQLLRPASPVFDISYFFYPIASEEALNKLDFYLTEYYAELSQQIKKLGSDPDRLYPFLVFEKEWKSHCKYGVAMAFMLLKFMLAKKDEIPKFDEFDYESYAAGERVECFPKFDNEEEYVRRIRLLCEFMVKKNYL